MMKEFSMTNWIHRPTLLDNTMCLQTHIFFPEWKVTCARSLVLWKLLLRILHTEKLYIQFFSMFAFSTLQKAQGSRSECQLLSCAYCPLSFHKLSPVCRSEGGVARLYLKHKRTIFTLKPSEGKSVNYNNLCLEKFKPKWLLKAEKGHLWMLFYQTLKIRRLTFYKRVRNMN